ncbi:MAG: hypothetical protein P9L94_17345, partial [Candidatus Hinthialibacter antarcticus]|nr:hypothetical protein [Candidatus Hinthialibacter antarcticus]
MRMIRVRRAAKPLGLLGPDAVHPHEARDTLFPAANPFQLQLLMNARTAVFAAVLLMHPPNVLKQLLVASAALAHRRRLLIGGACSSAALAHRRRLLIGGACSSA